MTFSVIIINFKTPQLTIGCIKSILSLPDSESREIILIDNASEDGSVEKIRSEFRDRIKIIENRKNLGFAAANNQGAALAQGKYLLFLNSDTIVNEDIFESCQRVFESDDKIGIISPRLMTSENVAQKNAFGRFPTLWRLINQSGKREIKIPEGIKIFEIDWVSGCALMIRNDIFKEVSGWDDHFFLYYEDVDLCRRISEKGYKVAVNLESKITHLGGQSISLNSERKKYYYEAQDYYFKKNFDKIIVYLVKIIKLLTNH